MNDIPPLTNDIIAHQLSKKLNDTIEIDAEAIVDEDIILIEKLSFVDKVKEDFEEHNCSQSFDCARCGLIGNQVISHRYKVPRLNENNNFYSLL